MESYLIYVGKAALAAGAFYLAYLALFQNRKQFVFNRIYLPVSLALSFVIPLITFTTVNYIEAPATDINSFAFLSQSTVAAETYSESHSLWPHYLFGMYLLGITGFLLHLLTGHFNALRMVRKSQEKNLFGHRVHVTKKDIHPFSFFNKIVLSEKTLNSPNLKMIVAHENIHVKEKHTLDILAAELLFLLQWFNPFAWLMKDAVKNNLEYKTDHEIVKTNDPQIYQLAMVALADKKGVAPFLTALNGSQLKNRIIMMKKKTENRFAPLKKLVLLPLLAVLVMGLSNREVKTEIIQNETSELNNYFTENSLKTAASFLDENVGSEAEPEKGKFLISIEIKENQFILYGLEGCAFTKLTFSAKDNNPVAVNEFGMVSPKSAKPDDDSNFLFEIEKINDQIKLTAKGGMAWKELTFSPASQKHLVNETGVSLAGKNTKAKVESNSEQPGYKANIRLNTGAFDTTMEPLYIVDGKITKEINQVPPQDIKSISVLKDQSAIALYGNKAKNGVILITTKSKSYQYLDDHAQNVRPVPREEVSDLEEMPEFPGGETALKQYIASHTRYPESEKETGIRGRAYVTFKITKEGKVNDARIARGLHPPMDKEAVRVVSAMPDWKPGKKDGKPVDANYTVPVEFVLDNYPVIKSRATSTIAAPKPLYIIDGKEFQGNLDDLNPDDIKSIDVLKGESGTQHFGEKGKNGVILIYTKEGVHKSLQRRIDNSKLESNPNSEKMKIKSPFVSEFPLFILDGKEVTNIDDVSPENIEKINVLKGESATEQYGEKGKNGVIEITLKEPNELSQNEIPVVLNGKPTGKKLNEIDRDLIEKIQKMNPKEATKKYGDFGKFGVLEVSSRNVYTDKVKVKSSEELNEDKITSELELRKFIAKSIKYPVEAQINNVQGTVDIWAVVEHDGKITYFYDKRPALNIVPIEEVVVVAYSTKKKEPGKEAAQVEETPTKTGASDSSALFSLLKEEVKRVAKTSPTIEMPELKGKTVRLRVKFMLQE